MTSRWRQREATRASTWRQSLLFNSLLLLFPIFASHIITSAYTSDIATDPMGVEARTETRNRIDESLSILLPPGSNQREAWADRVEATLSERDFSAARGYLLSAPLMLDSKDARAVLAAAEAERSGTEDQRLARAALLFLPDSVRATYQRAISPPRLDNMPDPQTAEPTESEAEQETADATQSSASPDDTSGEDIADGAAPAAPSQDTGAPLSDPLKARPSLSLIGDANDLTRRSQRWLLGEDNDSMSLRLRGLGGLELQDSDANNIAFAEAASILAAAHRAGRLNERFSRYIESRIEDALPEETLRTNLDSVFAEVRPTGERSADVMEAFRSSIDTEALERLSRDMAIIARLAELTSSSGAITLVEQAATPEDMRRVQLLAEAGGERSVTLARELGRDVLSLARIGAKWTWGLAFQVMALTALGVALLWTAISALGQADTLRYKFKYG